MLFSEILRQRSSPANSCTYCTLELSFEGCFLVFHLFGELLKNRLIERNTASEALRDKIAECMLLYNKSGGRVLNGLTKRREAERKLFLTNVSTSNYYPKYIGSSSNIDIVLKSIGVESGYIGSWTCRKPIATKNGISNFTGTMEQNLKIVSLAKSGKLKRV